MFSRNQIDLMPNARADASFLSILRDMGNISMRKEESPMIAEAPGAPILHSRQLKLRVRLRGGGDPAIGPHPR